ncbi:DUF4244 domain-containing protein [Myceligenerans crystallogenes]|uniref:DUF4244 domain-containing protein n=1 Tax=Myceligenerans crystallogenes TaxID=316335 RepID=A0ABP4Z9Y1_9MICO
MKNTKVAAAQGTGSHPGGQRGRGGQGAPRDGEAGMATAEYAIGTLGAAGIAGLLLALLKGGPVKDMLMNLIEQALSIG